MIGDILKKLREHHQLTQSELCKQMGIRPSTYNNYERNRRCPDADALVRFAQYYHVSADYLLGMTQRPAQNELDTADESLLAVFHTLNMQGKSKALEYINDLGEQKKYIKIEFTNHKSSKLDDFNHGVTENGLSSEERYQSYLSFAKK